MNMKLKTLFASGIFAMSTLSVAPITAYAGDGYSEKMEEKSETLKESHATLSRAAETLQKMQSDPKSAELLGEAKGVFIVPKYARAGLGVGGAGGEGVLMVKEDGEWSGPMFYNMGSINVGLEAGVEAGEIAMVLKTDKAVETFMQENNFSLNADAGLTLVDFSERAQGSWGKGDIVMWSDTAGAFADLSVNIENIMWDEEENTAYYNKGVEPDKVADGTVKTDRTNPLVVILRVS